MKGITAVMVGSLLLFVIGCNTYIEKSKYEESQEQLQKARTELEKTNKRLEEAQKQVEVLSGHKYSTYRDGSRTWRFNAVTGETCILLAAEWDWKRKKTKWQSCDCQDANARYFEALHANPGAEDSSAVKISERIVESACSE